MYFRSTENPSVELRIINYQYPQIISGLEDSNWLLIYLNVKSDLGNWQTTDPCLLTNEVVDLVKWFNDLSENKKVEWNPMNFIEPNLSFEFVGFVDNLKKLE